MREVLLDGERGSAKALLRGFPAREWARIRFTQQGMLLLGDA